MVAPGNSMKAVTIESPMINERRRPRATGARRISPHDRYHGWRTGPSTTKSRRVAPSAFKVPTRSLFKSIQTPITPEASRPRNRVAVSTPAKPTPTWAKCANPEKMSAREVVGAVHERTAPGVPRIVTHPHPSPLT